VRHAQTVWNASGKIQGQADPPLSDRGRRQCEALAGRLRGTTVDRVWSSDLERARLTAAAIPTASPLELTPELREIDLGQWEGATSTELQEGWPELYEQWRVAPSWDLVPGGEGQARFAQRVAGALERAVAASQDGETVALVTHIGVIRTVLSRLAGLSVADLRWPWVVDNASISALKGPAESAAWSGPAVTITAVNDTAHLASI
jgi:broad specificity phosphatase PhoE